MSDIWIISDTHFQHANSLKFIDTTTGNHVREGFESVEQMDSLMIENWNKSIKPGDKVYHLGDVFMGDQKTALKLWEKLNGKKRLIVGNHDNIPFIVKKNMFQEVYQERKLYEFGIHLTHVPYHHSQLERGSPGSGRYLVNVHGHIHSNNSPPGLYINVCVEKTNYAPVHIEDIRAKAAIIMEEFQNR